MEGHKLVQLIRENGSFLRQSLDICKWSLRGKRSLYTDYSNKRGTDLYPRIFVHKCMVKLLWMKNQKQEEQHFMTNGGVVTLVLR
jgi:glutaredoxin 2